MIEGIIKRFYKETGKSLTTDAKNDNEHYSVDYVSWLENELVKKLNIDDVSNCLHENQVMRQGNGDVYHQCLDCCELLE